MRASALLGARDFSLWQIFLENRRRILERNCVVAPLYENEHRQLSAKARILLTRTFIVLIGLYVLYWGLIYQGRDDVWDYMAVTGAIYFSGAFSVLLGGLYWKRASCTGALLALLTGTIALAGLSPVQDALGINVSSARIGLITIGSTLAAMLFGSLLFPDPPQGGENVPGNPTEKIHAS